MSVMARQATFFSLATFFLLPVFVFAQAPEHNTPVLTATSTSALIATTSTPTFSSSDTAALIKELQSLVISLQTQINELKTKLETTQQEVAVVKSEVQFTTFLSQGAQGDEVKQLQELLKQDPDIYPEGTVTGFFGPATEAAVRRFQEKNGIAALGVIGPKTRAKLNDLIAQGAGRSGVIPPGSVRTLGQSGVEATTTTLLASTTSLLASTTAATIATTSPAILCLKDPAYCASQDQCTASHFFWYTVSCHVTPPPAYSCAASYNYCISPTECAAQGWYSCRNSCYPSVDACQGQTYLPPAAPAIPIVSIPIVVATTTTTATITPATTTITNGASSSHGSALNLDSVSGLFEKIWGPGSNGIVLGGGLNFSTQVGVGWSQQYGGKYVTSYSIQGVSSNYITQTSSVNVSVTGPAGSIIEVWDLETLTVIATNINSPGSPTLFTAQPNHRYGGFGWYSDNAQKNIEIRVALSSSSQTLDTTPPTISNIQATAITATSSVISWSTDEVSDSQVEWGGTTAYGAIATNPSLATSHSIPFSGLAPSATYHYRVKSKDAAGNQAMSADQTFTMSGSTTADTQPPSVPTGLYVTPSGSSGANLYWSPSTDNIAVAGYKVYQEGVFLIDIPSTLPTSVGGLSASRVYTVSAYDAAGNVSAQSNAITLPVTTATTTSAIIANSSLASVLHALRDALSTLTTLLQKSR